MSKRCRQCGEVNGDDALMCGMCGSVLQRADQRPAKAVLDDDFPMPSSASPQRVTSAKVPTPMPDPLWVPQEPVAAQPAALADAGFWHRYGAALFEMSLLALPLSGVCALLVTAGVATIYMNWLHEFGLSPFAQGSMPSVVGKTALISLVGLLILAWLYHAFMESSPLQGTVGKLAVHLRVIDIRGNRISFARASLRFFAKILSCLLLGTGFLLIPLSDYKQALHDKIAGTRVVRW
ncbi:MAG TPA: RDD family protein [Armatimonadota bacterium]|nr:RDD family protein [Armatimonadota bacterium]